MAKRKKVIWVADCETDPFKFGRIPAPFIWGAYNGTEYYEFQTTDEFINFISQLPVIVYAHNGGKFDWHYCIHRLETFSDLMVINGRLSKFKIGECEFRDSYNILPVPLKAFAKDEFDYTILEPGVRDIPANRIKIQKYLKSDCVNLYNVVSEFIDKYGSNLTLAGSALKQWEKIASTKAPNTPRRLYDEIAPFYYGGRVECFRTGLVDHAFKMVDINSAYPDAMTRLHPFGDVINLSSELPQTREYIERAFITLDCVSRGALPARIKMGLEFPNDNIKRRYTITGHEYLAGIDTGTISDVEIIEVRTFSDSISFADYVAHFYELKNNAEKHSAEYIFAKLFLNSLYGKFGANPENYNEYTIIEPQYITCAELEGYSYNAMLGQWALCSKPLDEGKQRYYNVATAASITGSVRAKLWRALVQCDTPLYCDTDSIACVDTGALELDAHKLGAWDLEAEFISGGIGGKKMYAFKKADGKYKTASKGVRLSPEEILLVAAGGQAKYMPENPSYSLKRGISFITRNIRKSA